MALTLEELHQRLSDPNKNFVIGPDGSRLIIDKEQEEEAFRKGYRIATPEERQKELWHKEFGEGLMAQTAAGTAGVLRGITFGLSDPILAYGAEKIAQGLSSVTGQPLRQDLSAGGVLSQLETQNPAISTSTEIAGAVLPAVLTGGGSAGATAGSMGTRAALRGAAKFTPAGAAAMLGRAAEHKAADIITRLAGEGLLGKGLSKIAGSAAEGIVEGGLFGAGEYVSKWGLEQEPEFTAEGLIDHMKGGALLGATAGSIVGGVTALPEVTKGVGKLFIKGLDDAQGSISPTLAEKAKNAYNSMASWRSGVPKSEIEELWQPINFTESIQAEPKQFQVWLRDMISDSFNDFPTGNVPDGQSVLKKVLDVDDEAALRIMTSTDKLSSKQKDRIYSKIFENYREFIDGLSKEGKTESIDTVRRKYIQDIKSEELKNILPVKMKDAFTQANDILMATNAIGKELADNPDIYLARSYIRDFNIFTRQFEKDLDGLMNLANANPSDFSPKQVYDFITSRKERLDNLIQYDIEHTPRNYIATINKIKDLRSSIKDNLINDKIWGEPIVRVQELNEVLHRYYKANNNFKQYFGRSIISPTGQKERMIDSSKLTSFLKNIDSPANTIKKEIMTEFNKASQDMISTLRNSSFYKVSSDDAARKVSEKLGLAVDIHSFLNEILEKDRLFTDVSRRAKDMGLLESLPLIGGIIQGSAGGFVGGAMGALATMPISLLLKTGKDPALEIRMAKKIADNSKRISEKISESVKKLGEVSVEGAIAPTTIIVKKPSEKKQDYSQYMELARTLQNDPELLNRNLVLGLSEIDAFSPMIAGIMREKLQKTVQFITAKIPKSYSPDPLRPELVIQPSYYEKAKFQRYMRAIDKPLTVFEDMATGNVSPEGVEVLKELYPAIYSKFYEISMQHIAGGKLSRKTRLKLQNALGVSSGDINMYQAVYQTQEERKEKSKKLQQGDIKRITEAEEF